MFKDLLAKIGAGRKQQEPDNVVPYGGPFGNLLSKIGINKEATFTLGNKPTQPVQPTMQPTEAPIKSGIEGSAENLASFDALRAKMGSPVPSTAPMNKPSLDVNTMANMINVYGGKDAPLHKYAPQMAEATQYDFWKNNPELLALLPHLETSSGRNITRPNNLINYGIRDPKINELFERVGVEDALRRSLKEIGETGNTYSGFRTGQPLTDEELLAFASVYEPMNEDYGPNLVDGRQHIRKTLGW